MLIAVSSSGRSPNIVNALTWARDHGLRTIAITGFDGGAARRMAEVAIHVDSTNYGIVEDLHQAVMHALAQYIRQSRMTADVISRRCSDHDIDRQARLRRMRVAINLLTEEPDEPIGRPLVLDSGHPRDGQATGLRRRAAAWW